MELFAVLVFYIISVLLLILNRIGALKRGRILFKTLSSIIFILIWFVSSAEYVFVMLIPLVFYMAGDIILVLFSGKKGFITGMAAFLTGNIVMIFILISEVGIRFSDFIILAVVLVIAGVGMGYRRLDFAGTESLLLYISSSSA